MAANQSAVTIQRKKVNMNEGHWTAYYNYYFNKAFSRLNKGGLAVYCFLCQQVPHYYDNKRNEKNIGGKPFNFSPAAVEYNMGIDKKTAQRGWKELIEVGYLVETKPFRFYFKDVLDEDLIINYNEEKDCSEILTLEEIQHKIPVSYINIDSQENNKRKKFSWED